MRKIQFSVLIISAIIMLGSCGKSNPASPIFASFMYVNASPALLTAPIQSIYVNDSLYTSGALITYNSNTGYLGILPGLYTTDVKQVGGANAILASDVDALYNANDAFTIIGYDSLTTGNTIRLMKLKDNLSVPAVDSTKIRFWHLAPNYPTSIDQNIDVTYLRTSVTPNDSVTFAGRNFAGASPLIANFEKFRTIPSGTYSIKFKKAGTQTVVSTVATFTAGRRKIYSHYITGTAAGRAWSFNSIVNF